MEKVPLQFQSAAKATQGTVAGNDTMAGDYNSQRVFTHRLPDCARCLRSIDASGDPGIASGLSIGDEPERLPYLTLKGGSPGEVEVIGESGLMTSVVIPEALYQVVKRFRGQGGLTCSIAQHTERFIV